MAFGSSGDRLFVAAGDTVCAFDAWSGSELWRTVAPKAFGFMIVSPMALAASQRGELAVAFDNGTIGIYSETGELRRRWKDNDLPVSLAFLDCGEVVGADPFAICKWDTQTGSRVRRGVRDRIFAMAAHPSGWAVTRSWHEATVWNVPEDTVVATVPVRPGLPLVAMSPRGRRLALGAEHAVQIYSVDGQYLSEFDFPELRVTSIAFTPTGSRLAVGDSDGELRFVDLSPL